MAKFITFILLIIIPSISFCESIHKNYDIIVYGNSSAAVVAAIQASRMGRTVLFISSDRCIGGLTSSGLGATDLNDYRAVGGLAREFYHRVYEYYSNSSVWYCQDREQYFSSIKKRVFSGINVGLKLQWVFEPHVAQKKFFQMLAEENVDLVYGMLDLNEGGTKLQNNKILSLKLVDGREYVGKIFIDASYEGDLMAKSNVSYIVGRESNTCYNETMNGILPNSSVKKSEIAIDPFLIKGNKQSSLLPFVETKQPGNIGEGDHRIQAYCFRMTLTNNPSNYMEIPKPLDYNSLWYEFIIRLLQANPNWSLKNIITITPMPNMKTDINHIDLVGGSYDWPEATYDERIRIKEMHYSYTLGLLWFLKNDVRVPHKIRDEIKSWGLCKDEFVDNKHLPYQLYVREARRMISDYVMTEHEIIGSKVAPYAIGLGTYWLDSHVVSRFVDGNGCLRDEGSFWGKKAIYPISYLSIVPSKKDCSNLFVPVCLSASHAAYGSIRMEPIYMVLGQSAAIAASLCLDMGINVQNLDYTVLEEKLIENGQILKLNN